MASLVGQQLKDTYDSLLKTSDNDALGGTYKEITDGAGNGSGLYLGTGGNVGIGTGSPSAGFKLDVNGDIKAGFRLSLGQSGGNYDGVGYNVGFTTTSGNWNYVGNDTASLLSFESGGFVFRGAGLGTAGNPISFTERMRIDSSGNVLVAQNSTTSPGTGNTTVGISLRDAGAIHTSRDGNRSLYANRNTSDGPIISVQKDGTEVGSIGTDGGNLTVNSEGTGGYGRLQTEGTDAYIWYSGSFYPAVDDSKDLGTVSYRFKDLYLSGSVYLGGTTSANALDDYEEGTWSPVFAPQTGSFTTMTMDVRSATYTKVGRQVTVRAYFRTDNVDATGASNELRVSGLPFASAGESAVSVGLVFAWGTAPDSGYVQQGESYIILRKTNATVNSQVSDLTTGVTANQNQMMITATYFV